MLSSVVSSYLTEPDVYVPFFLFPKVSEKHKEQFTKESDDFISQMIGAEAATLINNGIARLEGYSNVVFIGLDEKQMSFFQSINEKAKIHISNVSEVEEKLKFLGNADREKFYCKPSQILEGLYLAKKEDKVLTIQENSPDIQSFLPGSGEGVIIIERLQKASSVIALNYAFAIGASVKITPQASKTEVASLQDKIQKYYEGKNLVDLKDIKDLISTRFKDTDFAKFKFVTCFTEGIPYSLALENRMPISYVHLSLRPDFFIFNNIIEEAMESFDSVIVFSPRYFKDDEETDDILELFNLKQFYVTPLVGENATVRNFDLNVAHFPYDILHICSHGGETDGFAVTLDFSDRKDAKHRIEYDEVVGFAPVPGTDKVEIHSKAIFKKLDGYTWMGVDLKKQAFPQYVFEDMRKAILDNNHSANNAKRERKKRIPTSCAIRCFDSIHQGMFRSLASHNYPFVFNNTCWSWYEVSTFFIAAGARGYIGTLWAIENETAVIAANKFYEGVFNDTLLNSFFKMNEAISGRKDRDIYIFWGLHFSRMKSAQDLANSRKKVLRELVSSLIRYIRKIRFTKIDEVKKNSLEISYWIQIQINKFSNAEKVKLAVAIDEGLGYIKSAKKNETRDERNDNIQEHQSIDLN